MGKKKSKKEDNWEDEADAIAQENAADGSDAAVASSGASLNIIFDALLREKKATEADFDRATDELASGAKTEEELVAEWRRVAVEDNDEGQDFERKYGFGGDLPPAQMTKAEKQRRWRQEEGSGWKGRVLAGLGKVEEDATELSRRLLLPRSSCAGEDDSGEAAPVDISVEMSDLSLDMWRRAVTEAPAAFALPGLTGISLTGSVGVSTQADRFVRLWDVASGRRLAAHQHKLELTACAADGGVVAIGDAAGGLLIFNVEAEFLPFRLPPPETAPATAAVGSIALLPLQNSSSTLILASSNGGGVTASLARTDPWPPVQMTRVTIPFAQLGDDACGVISLALGAGSCVFGAAGAALAMYDMQVARTVWDVAPKGDADEWAGSPTWSARCGRGAAATQDTAAPATAAAVQSRPLSFSPYWKLLAAAVGDVVALWDVRLPGDAGPAVEVRTSGSAGSGGVGCIHIDEGQTGSGHLLIAPCSGGVV